MLRRLLLALALGAVPACAIAQSNSPEQLRVVGYYFGPTLRRGFPVSSIKGELLTHVNYAFANISEDGRAVLGDACLDVGECAGQQNPHARPGGNFAELRRLKQRHPHLRTLISIGGWSWSARFSDAAATPEARRRFVESVINTFFRKYPGVFDGVDLDWEYPVAGGMEGNRHRPEDRANYTLLISDLRSALDRLGRPERKWYLLTIGAGAGLTHIRHLEVPALARKLDFINVMTYDYHTGGAIAHFNAPLDAPAGDPTPENTARASIEAYIAAGAPPHKLVLGVPFYGYGYAGVDSVRNGLFQKGSSKAADSASPNPWTGALRFYRISEAMRSGFTRYWDAKASVPWLYDARTRTWITYDDAESLALKADFARRHKLGGIMIWELSGDDGTLLPAIRNRLRK